MGYSGPTLARNLGKSTFGKIQARRDQKLHAERISGIKQTIPKLGMKELQKFLFYFTHPYLSVKQRCFMAFEQGINVSSLISYMEDMIEKPWNNCSEDKIVLLKRYYREWQKMKRQEIERLQAQADGCA